LYNRFMITFETPSFFWDKNNTKRGRTSIR